MLNLLISIIGNTYGNVSEVNELIYEKNRLMIVNDCLGSEKFRANLNSIQDKYLVTICQENPNHAELSDFEKKFDKFAKESQDQYKEILQLLKKK